MIFLIRDDELNFPDPRWGDPDGMFAVGGDLSLDRLILAYSKGIFPWYAYKFYKKPHWYCPMSRFVIFPSEIHISHSMRTMMNNPRYEVTFNQEFVEVMQGCRYVDYRDQHLGSWLGKHIIKAYTELYRVNRAISVEVWKDKILVGGLYGVVVGRNVIGESMFSDEPSASKLALIHLAKEMEKHGGGIIDCQVESPHLKSMGARHIPYDEYLRILHS